MPAEKDLELAEKALKLAGEPCSQLGGPGRPWEAQLRGHGVS